MLNKISSQRNKLSIQQKSDKGFTLIEMLVSIALFSIVLVIVLGAMLTIINVNRRAQALASVINNFNSSVESMNRVIKSAEPTSISVTSYEGNSGGKIELTINNEYNLVGAGSLLGNDNVDVSFRFNETDGSIERSLANGAWLAITADDVTIQKLQFIKNTSPTQPEVIIIIAGEAGVDADSKTSFEIMTTVSQRQIEIQ
jgi:prepilin-type N-terminal cleavage/methylation domain-containing protein